MFLTLLEKHIVILHATALRPALRPLLLCLLPALEEENSEDFDRTLRVIDGIRKAINMNSRQGNYQPDGPGDEYFWQGLFLSAISGDTRRQGILVYLVRRLPKLGPAEPYNNQDKPHGAQPTDGEDADQSYLSPAAEAVVSPEPGLLIRCFAAGLQDDQALIQRGFLDLLLSHLPLNSLVLTSRLGQDDLELLVGAATVVVARRDMSLNRRLWSWFLGPHYENEDAEIMSPITPLPTERKDNKSLQYFTRYGLAPLSNSILKALDETLPTITDRVKPYRIALSLMDRWEIGQSLVPRIFVPALRSLLSFKTHASEDEYQEVLPSASGFFDGVESGLIWANSVTLIKAAFDNLNNIENTTNDDLSLISLVLEDFNVRDEEMIAFHIPLCCVYILTCVHAVEGISHVRMSQEDQRAIDEALHVVQQMVDLMPERAQLNTSFSKHTHPQQSPTEDTSIDSIRQDILTFYTHHNGDLSNSAPPFSSQDVAHLLLRLSSEGLARSINEERPIPSVTQWSQITSNLVLKTPETSGIDVSLLCQHTTKLLERQTSDSDRFAVANSQTRLLTSIYAKASANGQRVIKASKVFTKYFETLWLLLSPTLPKYHVESVRMIWQIDSADPSDGLLESSISQFISLNKDSGAEDAEDARRFATLWTHSMSLVAGMQRRSTVSRRSSLLTKNAPNIDTRDHQSILVRPLLLALEGLQNEGTELYFFLLSWLRSSGILYTIFDVLIAKLITIYHHQQNTIARKQRLEGQQSKTLHGDRTDECCYLLKHILRLLRLPLDNISTVLAAQGSAAAVGYPEAGDSLQEIGITLSIDLVGHGFTQYRLRNGRVYSEMQCSAMAVAQQLLNMLDHPSLELPSLERKLLDMMGACVRIAAVSSSVQSAVLDTTMSYLKARPSLSVPRRSGHHRKVSSIDATSFSAFQKTSVDRTEQRQNSSDHVHPPEQLLKRLLQGIESPNAQPILENWVAFLVEVLPLYAHSLFQNLIPIVDTFCKSIRTTFHEIEESFTVSAKADSVVSETSLLALLNGLEHILAIAHDRLALEESSNATTKTPEPAQSFFGNAVSAVFASESMKGRPSAANSKLTVILCFQDAVKISFSIWAWAAYGNEADAFDSASAGSFSYSSSRLRSRARRLLDRVFLAETLECLETLVSLRDLTRRPGADATTVDSTISLLHTLDGSRPKRIMPTIFNALYSRTNPSALEPNRMSSLTTDLQDSDLGIFLIDYTKSLDDDAMDEIWTDCMTFLRDVLSNPLVHSSILPCLLLFVLTLGEKVEKTNFGEQRRMRKDLSDLFQRLLAATFTSRPAGILNDPSDGTGKTQGLSVIEVLTAVVPKLQVILQENDKQLNAVANISNHILGPLIHSKAFPENLNLAHLTLLQRVTRVSSAVKVWRKDVGELFSHPKLFACDQEFVQPGLLPLLSSWGLNEKDRLSDTLQRIPAPTTAGLMFGVGANAARLDSDKKAQLNLRRVTLLILALDTDSVIPALPMLHEKVSELLHANAASSPSSTTRAEVFMLLQAVVLKTSPIHLSALWTMVTSELAQAIASTSPEAKGHDTYNTTSLLQACKLLDLLLLIGPDDFQMHAWLFITDTIDAVYRPVTKDAAPVSLVDEIAEELSPGATGTAASPGPSFTPTMPSLSRANTNTDMMRVTRADTSHKKLLLRAKSIDVVDMAREEMVAKVLRPWFAQLSLQSFEREYSMKPPDLEGCKIGLLKELFEEKTMVGSSS